MKTSSKKKATSWTIGKTGCSRISRKLASSCQRQREHVHMYGLLLHFRGCESLSRKPINAKKIGDNPRYTILKTLFTFLHRIEQDTSFNWLRPQHDLAHNSVSNSVLVFISLCMYLLQYSSAEESNRSRYLIDFGNRDFKQNRDLTPISVLCINCFSH